MNKEFLERLFLMCSDEGTRFAGGLYEQFSEADTAWDAVIKKLEEAGLIDLDEIGNEISVLSVTYEKQGFVNGFSLGMKLAKELGEEVADA